MSGLSDERRREILAAGRQTLTIEKDALSAAAERLGDNFVRAAEVVLGCTGKVVVTGLGKSGHVARKVASTLSSTGTSALYLHPSEAQHGDFGVMRKADALVAIAFGGETAEVIEVVTFAKRIGIPVIGITGNLDSRLAQLSDQILDGSVSNEACPLNLAPTSSSTLALALGDALAVAVMEARGFGRDDFAQLHPGGTLGRRLLTMVKDIMRQGEELPLVTEDATFHRILEAVTKPNFGIVGVVDHDGQLQGAITDGDLRRALLDRAGEAVTLKANDLLTPGPKTIFRDEPAINGVRFMEDFKITTLFVVDRDDPQRACGLLRMHDLLAAKII